MICGQTAPKNASLDDGEHTMRKQIGVYMEMIKFGHTVFALPFALIAWGIATHRMGTIRLLDFLGVLCCMIFARTAAMGFNRWADHDFDAQNPRTKSRALPAGLLSPAGVLAFTVTAGILFFASTSIFWWSSANPWPMVFAGPMLAYLLGYSYAKRFTSLAHLWLGCALAASPVAVWVALLPPGDWWTPFLLAVLVASWVTGFDIIYAIQDLEVDRKLGLRSIPAAFGAEGALGIARLLHLVTSFALLAWNLATPELGTFTRWASIGVVILLVVEHVLASRQTTITINWAFFQINAVIGIGLALAVGADLWGQHR
jgi:4-hydroxybenzoate polyprenyltransferase